MSRRVLFVTHAAQPGGAELYLADVAHALRDRSAVAMLADGPLRARLESAGVDVRVVRAGARMMGVRRDDGPLAPLAAIPAALGAVRALARLAGGFDVVYANSQKAHVVAALAARIAGRPYVWNLHDLLDAQHFGRLQRRLAVRLANGLADVVVCNSRATVAAFVAAGGDEGRTRVVYNGVDAARFDVEPDAARAARAVLAPPGVPVVSVFSRLARWKGQHVLIEALAELGGVHAAFVGGALFAEDERYEAELRRQVAERGLEGRVRFMGFRDDVPALMAASDVVVHTSTAPEPFGRVVVEGMLARRAVVATRGGGVDEIVRDGETGVLVPPGDAPALAAALGAVLADGALRERLGCAGRADAVARFGAEQMVRGVAAAVDAAADAAGAGRRVGT